MNHDLALRISMIAYILVTCAVQRSCAASVGVGAGVAALPHVLQQVRAPVDAGLDAARKIGRGRAALRSGRHQQVREAVHQHAEEGRRRRRFHLSNSFSPPTPRDVDLVIGAGDGVEAGGIDDDVEVVVARAWCASPFSVTRSIGVSLMSTRCTLSRL